MFLFPANGYVQETDSMVGFSFQGEFQFWCQLVKAIQDVVYICFAFIVENKDIIYVTEITFYVVVNEDVINFGAFQVPQVEFGKYGRGQSSHG